jgi:hypothetical protein
MQQSRERVDTYKKQLSQKTSMDDDDAEVTNAYYVDWNSHKIKLFSNCNLSAFLENCHIPQCHQLAFRVNGLKHILHQKN